MKKLLLIALSLFPTSIHAQTYNVMQWGMDKTVSPYNFGANINGTWRNLGTVSSAGLWTLSYNGGIQSPTTFPLSIIFTGSGTSANAFLNQSGIASSATLPEIGGQFTITSNVGNANKSTAYKIALTSSVVSQANSADIYALNAIAAGYNTHLITGIESDVNINGGAPGTYGSATGAYAFVATTGGLSPITAGYWAVASNAGSITDGFAATNNIVRTNFYAGAPAQYGLLLSGTQTAAQILGVGFNVTPSGALNTSSANVSTAVNGYYLNNQHTLFDDGTYVVLTNHNNAAQAIALANLYSFYSADNHIFRNTATSTNYLTLSPSSATFNSPIQAGVASTTTGSLAFANASSAFLTKFQAGNASAAVTYTLPTAAPAGANYALLSNASGTMSWASPATLTTLTPGTTPTSGGAAGQLMYDTGSLLQESANLVFSSNTLTVGKATSATGALALGGATSGAATLTAQNIAGTPILTLPTTTGTLASSASSPLALNATTGVLTCATCVTSSGGGAISGTTPIVVSAAGVVSLQGATGTLVAGSGGTGSSFTATPTLGVQSTTAGTLTLANTNAGAFPTTLASSASSTAAWTLTLPVATPAANGSILTSTTAGISSWASTLPVANGGTNCSAASITCFNNITGFTASGTTGTTSTNLVFSTSPTLVTPALGAATGTSLALNGATLGANALSVAGTTNMTGNLTIASSTQYTGFNLTNSAGTPILSFLGLSAGNDGGTLTISNLGNTRLQLSAVPGFTNTIQNGGILKVGNTQVTVTISIATPGVITLATHGLHLGQPVVFATTGALPTGLTAGTTYYAVPTASGTFNVATSLANALAGTVVATSGTQSGTQTMQYDSIAVTTDNGSQNLNVQGGMTHGIQIITAAYAVLTTDYIIHSNTNAAAVPTFPTAVGRIGQKFIWKNNSGSAITPVTTSSQTIDGAAPVSLANKGVLRIYSDGANWQSW